MNKTQCKEVDLEIKLVFNTNLNHLNHNNAKTPYHVFNKNIFDCKLANWKNSKGGLRTWNTFLQNKALFSKLDWRILKNPTSLWASVLKVAYFPNNNFLKATCKMSSPKFMKNLIKINDETLLLWCWDLGDPTIIRRWDDPRIPTIPFKNFMDP